ncbi:hypothetical protein C1645_818391 [Glomus cerebriforme]|uniref:Serine-threonine/tyrosine-protein kinase catalytic domain-containing protein n=1 Tax=Glomus cerebriforme TaxID=658196 RepID=A0A397TGS5_9GLOM|nr:hypothetical protein C1645_818391 [Glomus cerebriforme]
MVIITISNLYKIEEEKGTYPDYVRLLERCWNSDLNERPTAEELEKSFDI